MKSTLASLLFCLLCLSAVAQSYTDPQALELIRQGKTALESRDYQRALEDFAAAAKRPVHNRTDQASYFAGLASHYGADHLNAIAWFDYMIQNYPNTAYVSEAIYHRGLSNLSLVNLQNKVAGLNDLFFLFENPVTPIDLRTNALSAIRQKTFYELDMKVLEYVYTSSKPGQTPLIAEALCYRYMDQGVRYSADRIIADLRRRGIPTTDFINKLMGPRSKTHYYEPNAIKLALMLPMYLPANKNAKPNPKGAIGRDFYEGFRIALSDFQRRARKRIYLKVFDTKRDPNLVDRQLQALEELYPDMVLGDIFNQPSEIISKWCHERGIPQMSPLSPTLNQAEKPLLLLGHPSVETHGQKMAAYARQQLKLNKVVVWSDGRAITERIANAYAAQFAQLGGEVTWVRVDSNFSKARGQILRYITTRAKTEKPDGHYIPLPSEEMCGLILSEMNYRRMKTYIMGSPNWQYFESIDRGLMVRYRLMFSSGYFVNEDDPIYKAFAKRFKTDFKRKPNADHVQGYDFGMYILQMLDRFDYTNRVPLDQYIRAYGNHKGFHINFFYNGHFDNQAVHICSFSAKGFDKMN
ncbi:MAG: ABC transporter substrate-binding protein [Bacteroidia bacterium]